MINTTINLDELQKIDSESSMFNHVYIDIHTRTKVMLRFYDDSYQVDISFMGEYEKVYNWVGSCDSRDFKLRDGIKITFRYGDLWT